MQAAAPGRQLRCLELSKSACYLLLEVTIKPIEARHLKDVVVGLLLNLQYQRQAQT